MLGRYIVEREQQGAERAKYGAKAVDSLSAYLAEEYGRGHEAMLQECGSSTWRIKIERMELSSQKLDNLNRLLKLSNRELEMAYNKIPFKLSWTHYQVFMHIEDRDERDFYEKEAIRSNRNINTLKR